ncbi:MAG: hypothetical protein ACD_5C00206G0012 [uncultured bacterium]|nr:MAG: hypothetical protein ACD_5C00206G0012 [uncultured bacterium]
MITQTILELKREHEIHKLEILMEKTIKEESSRDEMSSNEQSSYITPAALRLGILTKQATIPRIEPANYCPF